jgi:iron complex transport system substrate-binding protein
MFKFIFSRQLAVVIIAAMLLTLLGACGDGAEAPVVESPESTAPAAQSEQQPEAASNDVKAGSTRLYTDALEREVEIPVQPERVVALWSLGDMLLLGTKPVASTSNLLRFYTDEQVADVFNLGESNYYESTLSMNPDLILVSSRTAPEELEAYEKIAPTVAMPFFGDAFTSLSMVADVLGRQKEEQMHLDAYAQKVLTAQAAIKDEVAPGETAFVMQFAQKAIYSYPSYVFPTIFQDLGFTLHEKQAEMEKSGDLKPVQLSEEILMEYDTDRIFVIINDEDSRGTFEELAQGPVWRNLQAVKNNRVYLLNQRLSIADASTLDWAIEELPRQILEQAGNGGK